MVVMSKSTLAGPLKCLRTKAGLSQRALAARLGVHQPQIAKVEAGDDMLVSRLMDMARELGCELMLVPKQHIAETDARIRCADMEQKTRPASDRKPMGSSGSASDDIGLSLVESYGREWPDVDPHVFAIVANIQRLAEILN